MNYNYRQFAALTRSIVVPTVTLVMWNTNSASRIQSQFFGVLINPVTRKFLLSSVLMVLHARMARLAVSSLQVATAAVLTLMYEITYCLRSVAVVACVLLS